MVLSAVAVGCLVSGCGLSGNLFGGTPATGKRTTTTSIDKQGNPVVVIDEDVPIGDPNFYYYDATKEISRNSKDAVKAKADGIVQLMTPAGKETPAEAALMRAFGSVMIRDIDDMTSQNIKAVIKAVTGYDVAEKFVDMFRDLVRTGVPWIAAAKMVGAAVENAGDRTNNLNQGDNNQFSNEVNKVNSKQDTSILQSGDTPNAGVNNGDTVGPDKSNKVENNELPAASEEVPVAEGGGE